MQTLASKTSLWTPRDKGHEIIFKPLFSIFPRPCPPRHATPHPLRRPITWTTRAWIFMPSSSCGISWCRMVSHTSMAPLRTEPEDTLVLSPFFVGVHWAVALSSEQSIKFSIQKLFSHKINPTTRNWVSRVRFLPENVYISCDYHHHASTTPDHLLLLIFRNYI